MNYVLEVIIVILIGVIFYLVYETKKQYKKGTNDILNLFLDGAYEQRVNWFKTANKYIQGRPSVFVGDSITQEFMLTEMFNGYNVCNRGIGGDTTVGVLKRLNESIFDLKPCQIFLMIGTNDIELNNSTTDEIVMNIKEICEQSIKQIPDLTINIVSLTPVNPSIDSNTVGKRTNKQIDEINERLKSLANNLKFNYIDINSVLKGDMNHIKPEYTREGLHLSPNGYEQIVDIYKKFIQK